MLVAFALTVVIGAVVAIASAFSERLQIADDLMVGILVCVSGAVAGWALVGTVGGVGGDEPNAWDVIAALAGALVMATAAWRGRRRTFDELALAGPPVHQ